MMDCCTLMRLNCKLCLIYFKGVKCQCYEKPSPTTTTAPAALKKEVYSRDMLGLRSYQHTIDGEVVHKVALHPLMQRDTFWKIELCFKMVKQDVLQCSTLLNWLFFEKSPPLSNARHEGTQNVSYCSSSLCCRIGVLSGWYKVRLLRWDSQWRKENVCCPWREYLQMSRL